MISKCIGCKAQEFQDGKYGAKFRVMNEKDKTNEMKCTVCGKIHTKPNVSGGKK